MDLKRVKERGCIAIAQDPAEAELDEMPRNAIATGLVDSILPARAGLHTNSDVADVGDRASRDQAADDPVVECVITHLLCPGADAAMMPVAQTT